MKHTPMLRLTAALLSLVLVLALLPASAQAAASGDFEYTLYDDGTVTITKYTGSATHVTVPGTIDGHPVYSVDDDAFLSLDTIESITFGEGIEAIAQCAVYNCDSLIRVNFPSTLSYLYRPVVFCNNFREVSFPNGNPNYVAKDNVIYNADMRELLVYPSGKTDRRFVAPGSLLSIAAFAFYCQEYVEEVVLPDSVEYLGFASFQAARKLERLNIPANCSWISQFALDDIDVKYLHIPAKLDILFANNCPSGLECITVDPANPKFIVVDKGLYDVNENGEPDSLMMYCCADPSETLVIPDSVVFLASGSLLYAYNLSKLDLGSGMKQVANDVFPMGLNELIIPTTLKQIDDSNFDLRSCNLFRMYYQGTEEQWNAIDGVAESVIWNPIHFNVTDPDTHSTNLGGTPHTCTSTGKMEWSCSCGYSWTERPYGIGHVYNKWTLIEYEAPDYWVYERKCAYCDETETETTTQPKCLFYDVDEYSFYSDSVIWADARGITTGTAPWVFSPKDFCMRAQVVTFLWRAAGCPEPTTTDNPFVDVKETDFYYKAVLWALEKGITSGLSPERFGPFEYCNRAQVVTFLYRTMGSPELTNDTNPFTDVPPAAWYTAPVLWAVEQGITNGLNATTFGPTQSCNRAQVVTFLYRAYND